VFAVSLSSFFSLIVLYSPKSHKTPSCHHWEKTILGNPKARTDTFFNAIHKLAALFFRSIILPLVALNTGKPLQNLPVSG